MILRKHIPLLSLHYLHSQMALSNAERQRRWRDNGKQLRASVASDTVKSQARDRVAADETPQLSIDSRDTADRYTAPSETIRDSGIEIRASQQRSRKRTLKAAVINDRMYPSAFRKMQVVGPREAVATDEVMSRHTLAQAARDYNPTLNAIAESQMEMRDVLDNYGSPPACAIIVGKRKQNTRKYRSRSAPTTTDASSSLALYNASLQRLHALMSQLESSYEPLVQMLLQNGVPAPTVAAAVAAPAGAQPAAPPPALPPQQPPALFVQPAAVPPRNVAHVVTASPSTSSPSGRTIDLSHVLASLPKTHRDRYTWVHDYIEAHPDVIGQTSKGRLTIYGAPVQDVMYTDAVRALYTNPRGHAPAIAPGLPEFVGALKEIGVPRSLISSKAARAQYALLCSSAKLPTIGSQSGKGHGHGRQVRCLRIY